MSYAQINYSQKMGINPVYTIHDIGCLLTSFCNLLQRYGEGIDPASLNTFFVNHKDYILSPEDGPNVSDDLSWTSVTAYDSSITVSAVGSGTPNTNDAIVKFEYNSHQTGKPTTHFCLVSDYKNGMIIDSWDGTIKSWNGYGGPKSWASYKKTVEPQGGNNVTLTTADVQNLYQDILGRTADSGGLSNYTGKTLDFALKDMLNSQEYKSKIAAQYTAQINELQSTVNTLHAELSTAQSQTTIGATQEQIAGGKLIEALKGALNG